MPQAASQRSDQEKSFGAKVNRDAMKCSTVKANGNELKYDEEARRLEADLGQHPEQQVFELV